MWLLKMNQSNSGDLCYPHSSFIMISIIIITIIPILIPIIITIITVLVFLTELL